MTDYMDDADEWRMSGQAPCGTAYRVIADYPFAPVEAEVRERIRQALSPTTGASVGDTSSVEACPLPWYDHYAMFRVTDASWSNPRTGLYFLGLPDGTDLHRLPGISAPIHDVNAKAPVKLTEANVVDYMRFFSFFVRGGEGPFMIVDDPDDPFLPDSPQTREVLMDIARPPSREGMKDKGHFLVDAVVYYSDAAFIANMAVHPDGMVEMLDDEPIAADLDQKVDQPLKLPEED